MPYATCAPPLVSNGLGVGQSQGSQEVPMTEQPFTDDEYAFLRHVRFGQLPLAARPDQRVELTETESRSDRPDVWDDPVHWDLRHAG
ncbi:hypothetical protein ACX27O_10225 [Micromonospora sp. SD19]|nr:MULTISPECIES: hypothetical protein [Micromonospora]